MSRKVCNTWFYAIVVASLAASLYYNYPDIRKRFPHETALLEDYYDRTLMSITSMMQGYFPFLSSLSNGVPGEIMFDATTLARYDGKHGSKGLYLALLGQVFNVEKGAQHYREGGGYAFFAGKDASRAYITGDFTEKGLTDDLSDLPDQRIAELGQWVDFYRKEYIYKGKLVGRYYTASGKPTAELRRIQKIFDMSQRVKQQEDELKKKFPPCNSEYKQETGLRVWCSKSSGGIHRDWDGVPRRYHPPGMSQEQCVCVRNTGPPRDQPASGTNVGDLKNPNLKEYANCSPAAHICAIK